MSSTVCDNVGQDGKEDSTRISSCNGFNLGAGFSTSIHSALDTAEILRMVFDNLSPSSLKGAARVCRQWYSVAQPYLSHYTVWRDNPIPPLGPGDDFWVLHRMPPIKHILSCHFNLPWLRPGRDTIIDPLPAQTRQAWQELLEQLPRPRQGYSCNNIFSNGYDKATTSNNCYPMSQQPITRPLFLAAVSKEKISPTRKVNPTVSVPGTTIPKMRGHIRNLYMSGNITPDIHVTKVLEHVGASLTKLDLRFSVRREEALDLHGIFASCRRLTSLHTSNCIIKQFSCLHPQLLHGITGGHFDSSRRNPSDEAASDPDDDSTPHFSLALQHLSMLQTRIKTGTLECIIRHSPFLREFRLANIERIRPFVYPINTQLVLKALERHCPRLDTIQMPPMSSAAQPYPLEKTIKGLPRLERISLHDSDFTPVFYESLSTKQAQGACRITTLELYKTPLDSSGSVSLPTFQDELLHRFLCACPTLLRLYAYDIFFGIHHFEPVISETTLPSQLDGNECLHDANQWACHNLQTLELSFKSVDLTLDFQTRHRTVLEYLPRVCPRLVHLNIYLFRVSFLPEDGVECLTRLSNLETLGLGTSMMRVPKKSDVEWMRKLPLPAIKDTHQWSFGDWVHRKRSYWAPDSKITQQGDKSVSSFEHSVGDTHVKEASDPCFVWPKMNMLRMYYESTSAETSAIVEHVQEVIQNVRPEVDFRVIKEPDVERPLW